MVAKSYARIHCANLANAGILALRFKDEADYDRFDEMDTLTLPDIRTALAEKKPICLRNETKGFEVEVIPMMTDRERAMVIAGGLLNYTKSLAE